jgi:ATP-binding cassette subfamily B protein
MQATLGRLVRTLIPSNTLDERGGTSTASVLDSNWVHNKYLLLVYYLRQHWISYTIGIFTTFLTNWLAVSIPEYVQLSIDMLSSDLSGQYDLLNEYLWIMLTLAVSMVFIRTLSRLLFFNPGRAIECQVKNDMFTKLMQLQRDYYDKNPSGTIISRVNNDIHGIRMICGFGFMQVFNIASALSLTPLMMFQLSPRLTLYCVIPILIVFSIVRIGMHFLVNNMRTRQTDLQNLSGFTVASLNGIDVIRSNNLGAWSQARFDKDNQNLTERSLNIAWIRSFIMPVLMNLANILKVIVLLFGGMMVLEEEFTVGELTAFIAYTALLTLPLMGLGWVTTMFQQGMVGLNSIQSVLQQPELFAGHQSLPKAQQENLFQDGLTVRNLRFRYTENRPWVLQDINFHLKPGQTLGVLGRIGAGKSTLVNCINRYLVAEDGQICLNGIDINRLTYQDLRHSIRTVTQEPFLFSDTVENNIAFAIENQPEDWQEHFSSLLQQAALWEEIDKFPLQEQTIVGEKGILLSGGQKQRISLARAMATPCDLLILDNVLSAVDYETERYLLQQIFARRQAKSLLIVSHRVTAVEKADWILVLDEGQIVVQGTHEELRQQPGYYQEMWALQHETP